MHDSHSHVGQQDHVHALVVCKNVALRVCMHETATGHQRQVMQGSE
jgi:hypothetical protein